MIRWLRVVLPVSLWLSPVLIYMGAQAFVRIMEWIYKLPFFTMPDQLTPLLFALLALVYAVYRVLGFHPAFRPGYFEWLRGTPWTSQKPLPLGPIHLVGQDVVVVGLAAFFDWLAAGKHVILIQLFPPVYLFSLAVVHYLTGEKLCAYGVAFGVGWMFLFWNDLYLFLLSAAVCYALAWWGLRRSLGRFPWDDFAPMDSLRRSVRISLLADKNLQQKPLGWPHGKLGPEHVDFPSRLVAMGVTGRRDVLLSGLLVGWCFFVAFFELQRIHPSGGVVAFVPFLFLWVFGCMGRVAIYLDGYRSPLSLLGRLVRVRLIIPSYDKVFVAPLLATAVFSAAGSLVFAQFHPLIVVSTAATLTWWILLGTGPGLMSWRLTGNHCVTPGWSLKDLVRTS